MNAAITIGTTRPRSCSSAPANTAAMCSMRGSDVIARPREATDMGADLLRLLSRQLRDLRLAGGGLKDDRCPAEEALEPAAGGIDVLDPPDGHERAADGPDAGAQVDLVVADLIAPALPANARYHHCAHHSEQQHHGGGQPARQAGVVGEPVQAKGAQRQHHGPDREPQPPVADRGLGQALLGLRHRGATLSAWNARSRYGAR